VPAVAEAFPIVVCKQMRLHEHLVSVLGVDHPVSCAWRALEKEESAPPALLKETLSALRMEMQVLHASVASAMEVLHPDPPMPPAPHRSNPELDAALNDGLRSIGVMTTVEALTEDARLTEGEALLALCRRASRGTRGGSTK
jgi:hypothetical protein